MAEIVGRDDELAAIDAFLGTLDTGPAGLVLEGEPGIGKTILWRACVERAEELSYRVLVSRPTQAETALPFAGLADLFEGTLDLTLPRLPDPQRAALEVALLRAAPPEDQAEELALDRAVLGALQALAAQGPMVVAIDDAPYLDAPTGRVLTFALRRVTGVPLRLVLSQRAGEDDPLDLGQSPIGASVCRLELGPLTVDGLDELLLSRAGLSLARPRLRELHRLTGGNPYFALEIAQPLRDLPSGSDWEPRVPETLGKALSRRIEGLSDAARETLVLLAAAPERTVRRLEGLLTEEEQDGLAEAIEAEIVLLDGERVRLSHPLIASVAYSHAGDQERRELHLRLARAAVWEEERALHLALASEQPDEPVALELERAADQAWARGAPETAAKLLEHAARLTPSERDADSTRRLTGVAEHLQIAGDVPRAQAVLRALLDRLPRGAERARVLARLSQLELDPGDSARLAKRASMEAGEDLALEAGMHLELNLIDIRIGAYRSSLEHAREAARVADAVDDSRLLAMALQGLGYAKCLLGEGGLEELKRAVDLVKDVPRLVPRRESIYYPRFYGARLTLGLALVYADDLRHGRRLILDELEYAGATGQEVYRSIILGHLALLELRAGDWVAAMRYSKEGWALARQAGQQSRILESCHAAAIVDAHVGRLEEALEAAETGLAAAEHAHDALHALRFRAVLGFVALSRGDAVLAHSQLASACEALREMDIGVFSEFYVIQNEIDALVTLGELDQADGLVELLERKGAPLRQAWALAVAARGRALVLASRGDVDGARASLERALVAHERLPDPFELGRTLLAQGTIERRAKRKRPAREALERALEIFDQLGAPLWAEKAAGELLRVGGRKPSGSTLTPTEKRVAELVADGLSNKEVAAALFVTTHTVEGHLSRIYEKLGVRSRTELARRLSEDAAASQA